MFSIATLVLASCAGLDMPRGSSKGYTSARLVAPNPNMTISGATEREVYRMIQSSLKRQFEANGMGWGESRSDLVVAYKVIYQEPSMTASYDSYFGYGRDAGEITDRAHKAGVLESKRPDFFRSAAVIIDIIDAKTNELVYRNYAKGDVVKGVSADVRASRINAAVASALGEFFVGR